MFERIGRIDIGRITRTIVTTAIAITMTIRTTTATIIMIIIIIITILSREPTSLGPC